MLIDCETCVARDIACRDCVVNVLLAAPPEPLEIDDARARRAAQPGPGRAGAAAAAGPGFGSEPCVAPSAAIA